MFKLKPEIQEKLNSLGIGVIYKNFKKIWNRWGVILILAFQVLSVWCWNSLVDGLILLLWLTVTYSYEETRRVSMYVRKGIFLILASIHFYYYFTQPIGEIVIKIINQ